MGFHLVNSSPWPLMMSIAVFMLVFSMVGWMWSISSLYSLSFMMIITLLISFQWFRDITREASYQGSHTNKVQLGLKIGMMLFIGTEIMFFVSFFWTFFHSSLSPTMEIGLNWPPYGISTFDPMNIPLLNTIILVSSGVTLTWSHYTLLNYQRMNFYMSMYLTLILAIMFTLCQVYEYSQAPFSIADSVYGSIFFVATGFHGLHVIIGSIFLLISMIRLNQISVTHHIGFELAAWYWHFVDVVWLFLYLCIYWWGS